MGMMEITAGEVEAGLSDGLVLEMVRKRMDHLTEDFKPTERVADAVLVLDWVVKVGGSWRMENGTDGRVRVTVVLGIGSYSATVEGYFPVAVCGAAVLASVAWRDAMIAQATRSPDNPLLPGNLERIEARKAAAHERARQAHMGKPFGIPTRHAAWLNSD